MFSARRQACLIFVLAPSLSFAACNGDGQVEHCVCVTERGSHCLVNVGCRDSSECPSGTTCSPRLNLLGCPLEDVPCSCSDDPERPCVARGIDPRRACRVAPTGGDFGRALLNGLRVGLEFPLGVSTDDGLTISWAAPAGARVVSCALFSCVPEFETSERSSDVGFVISNFDNCVAAHGVFEAGESSMNLSTAPPYESPTCIQRRSNLNAEPLVYNPEPQVTHLSVGCWAYDEVDVFAATPLVALSAEQVPRRLVPIVVDGGCGSLQPGEDQLPNGRACVLSHGDGYGTCHQGVCARRCVRDSDCTEGLCIYPSNRLLGVCGSERRSL